MVSINRWMLLITWKPRNQEFTAEVITLRMFYDHHHNMVNTYGVTIQLSCPLSWLTYHYKSNTTGAVGGAGTDFPSGTHDFTSGFQWGSCCATVGQSCHLVPYFVFVHSFFVRRFKTSDYLIGIFKLFAHAIGFY